MSGAGLGLTGFELSGGVATGVVVGVTVLAPGVGVGLGVASAVLVV